MGAKATKGLGQGHLIQHLFCKYLLSTSCGKSFAQSPGHTYEAGHYSGYPESHKMEVDGDCYSLCHCVPSAVTGVDSVKGSERLCPVTQAGDWILTLGMDGHGTRKRWWRSRPPGEKERSEELLRLLC